MPARPSSSIFCWNWCWGCTANIFAFSVAQLQAANASAERIAKLFEQIETWKPLQMQMLLYFTETMVLGFIFSLIVSAVVMFRKRQEKK